MFQYACTHGLAHASFPEILYRCRKLATAPPNDLHCAVHKDSQITPVLPDVILAKMTFPRNGEWREDLVEEFNLHSKVRTGRDERSADQRHAEHAKVFHRDANAVRQERADSGTQVFGQQGLANVGLQFLENELVGAGYHFVGAHVLDRVQDEKLTLVMTYANDPSQSVIPLPSRANGFIKNLLRQCWSFGHIWANPPRLEDGKVFHTINVGGQREGMVPQYFLTFQSGLWWVR